MNGLQGCVALVTGAGKGTGRRIALALGQAGARVAINDINPTSLSATLTSIQNDGGTARAYPADIASRMAVQWMFDQIWDEWGRLDILVHSAGVDPAYPLLDLDEWDWQRTLNVNLGGAYLVMQIGGRLMQQAGGGVILTIDPAIRAAPPLDRHAAYWASQDGLKGLTRAAASEFAAYNIYTHMVTAIDDVLLDQPDRPQNWSAAEEMAQRMVKLCVRAINKEG